MSHPPVDEGPREVVNSILLVLNGLGHYLSVEVIMEEVVQMRLQPTENTQLEENTNVETRNQNLMCLDKTPKQVYKLFN